MSWQKIFAILVMVLLLTVIATPGCRRQSAARWLGSGRRLGDARA